MLLRLLLAKVGITAEWWDRPKSHTLDCPHCSEMEQVVLQLQEELNAVKNVS